MSVHLSDEQFTRYLSGEEDAGVRSHFDQCAQCQAEVTRVVGIVSASRAHAERSGDRHANFWARQRNEVRDALAIRRPRRPTWAIAFTMAALVILSAFLFHTPEPRPQLDQAQVQSPAINISDEALLSAVNSTLEQGVPLALVPVQRLAYERQAAERNRTGQN